MEKYERILSKSLYEKSISDAYNMDLSPLLFGYEKCAKNKPEISLNKNYYVMHIVIGGKGYLKYGDNKPSKIEKNTIFLYYPNEQMSYIPDKNDPWNYFWLELNGDLTKKLFDDISQNGLNKVIKIENYKPIVKTITSLLDSEKQAVSSKGEVFRINSSIYKIFSFIIDEHHQNEVKTHSLKKEKQMKNIIEYITDNYTEPDLTVDLIAQKFFYNPAYLTRIFKEQTGVSILKYIITLRMRRAADLLLQRTYTISQIAVSTGYKNQFYFSKEFKRFYGVPPMQYLKTHTKKIK